jgi:hypothetical protein
MFKQIAHAVVLASGFYAYEAVAQPAASPEKRVALVIGEREL